MASKKKFMVKKGVMSIRTHMDAITLRDIWARVMFLKSSKFENLKTSRVTTYHEMHERSYDFLFKIFSTELY